MLMPLVSLAAQHESWLSGCVVTGTGIGILGGSLAFSSFIHRREQQNTGFSFYLENKWCRGVKVDPSGKGLFEVWKRQIQQFNRVSGEMAEAVVSAYPSPQLLVQVRMPPASRGLCANSCCGDGRNNLPLR